MKNKCFGVLCVQETVVMNKIKIAKYFTIKRAGNDLAMIIKTPSEFSKMAKLVLI